MQSIYVRRKEEDSHQATYWCKLFRDVRHLPVTAVQFYVRYTIEGISDEDLAGLRPLIFVEAPVDLASESLDVPAGSMVIGRQFLPGQYDQRADSALQCLSLHVDTSHCTVRCAEFLVISGDCTEEDRAIMASLFINPVDSEEASLDVQPSQATEDFDIAAPPACEGFIDYNDTERAQFLADWGLAMSPADLELVQAYFQKEGRNPTETEIRVIDTYWSDHCRHTTFSTAIDSLSIEESPLLEGLDSTWREYQRNRKDLALYNDTELPDNPTLMEMATLAMKELRFAGRLKELEVSSENNACTIRIPVTINGDEEEWLLLFKNETHNHPTEIEPYGGAATCLGGCIRDPLSGRSYVYQAMRITGAANPLTPLEDTLPGKLPQRLITTEAARGFSAYGNQIGLATGEVAEYYHPKFVAKRMEVGAVIAAAPADAVRREEPQAGDIIVLVGGKTGRDGCGGATGSSKEHTEQSLKTCGTEVQKGNPIVERKLQRLFRRPEVTTCIKKCNDFGAGGVSVAIGELAPSLLIKLDSVPKKYAGLTATELAISESQERMAVVINPDDLDAFLAYCDEENVEAKKVATVTDDNRLVMEWQGHKVVDIDRAFLDTNGAKQHCTVSIAAPEKSYDDVYHDFLANCLKAQGYDGPVPTEHSTFTEFKALWEALVQDLSVTSQQGLRECFDSTIGANTVLMPFSGSHQKTPVPGMVAKIPIPRGRTSTVSIMTHGYNPLMCDWSPYHGAQYAILTAITKLVSLGGNFDQAYLSLQEYFAKLGDDPKAWGQPAAALLGAYRAQKELSIGAIGGKDSMSGTFQDLSVPPSLLAFAVTTSHLNHIMTPDAKSPEHALIYIGQDREADGSPDWIACRRNCKWLSDQITSSRILSIYPIGHGGIMEAVTKMCLGNYVGISLWPESLPFLTIPTEGGFLVEYVGEVDELESRLARDLPNACLIGETIAEKQIEIQCSHSHQPEIVGSLADIEALYEKTLAPIFPISEADPEAPEIPQALQLPPMMSAGCSHCASASNPAMPCTGDCESSGSDGGVPAGGYGSSPFGFSPAPAFTSLAIQTSGERLEHHGDPRVLIPVFPGTNCEYDTMQAFKRAGAIPETFIIHNQSLRELEESAKALVAKLKETQILMLAGGFSAGDEPNGAGKYIANFFRNPAVSEAVHELLYKQDGLILGICNGFQALLKLGVFTTGYISTVTSSSPTVTYNTIGRHISRMVHTRVLPTASPWFLQCNPQTTYTVPISHGEGRFMAPKEVLDYFVEKHQISTVYTTADGKTTMDPYWNPNQSAYAIEGLISPDGRILGKMGHNERYGQGISKNVPGRLHMPLFEGGVSYFC